MTRQEANKEILKIITALVDKHPDLRFNQILANIGVVKATRPTIDWAAQDWQNEYYMEPQDTLARIKERLDGQ